ncbi:bifunctional phosphopantothenoylcysteine decarboxylase/phosphopantothenate--cysteine ligase CoaBC [Arundinibacter roseus]|uniref:Coenzyme A biosynthesis bifunctional protein CoaBC n=1 Tax=Arundinibacter roseus TaxID=2070510 RepID=A0A4R4KIW2_9BACT|nr:bifunctional phosphopantothenoylcysteine decarboxylase/phosphopantothenate--cysteine ligase CoaBC [Arundinibacter roseus]TDB68200.1 bifunctional phosphopantothenoylcysteine decarboxylase/phosphopantothenate--cysteine ligase CoaBC [Arundinibacter roseus]
MYLKGKKVLLGVTGSISAYKSAILTRLLVKAGAEVQIVMTTAAKDFITPLTLSTLSRRQALSAYVGLENDTWNNHVELGLWADVMLIAPATARTLAKCANGQCDDLLTAVYLSARCPVFFAPAMDVDMYLHGSTQKNIQQLMSYGNQIILPGVGELASGLTGEGRLPEPEILIQELEKYFAAKSVARGKRVILTAGPTQEALDPVRYISNHSTGKMGYAIAHAFALAGADVTLISGPVSMPAPDSSIRLIKVRSAQDMYEACEERFEACDLAIFSAAVADYTPRMVSDRKIKKKETEFQLQLTKTVDIAATLGQRKKEHQLLVGFALETDNEMANAADKLHRKNLDYVILNSMNDTGAGFAHDTNKITVIEKSGVIRQFELKSKQEVGQDILEIILEKWSEL